MTQLDTEYIKKNYSIINIAKRLGIEVNKNNNAVCPFHKDTNPSLSFNIEKNYYHCFACGAGGDNIKLVRKIMHCDFKEAVKFITNTEYIQAKKNKKCIMPTAAKEKKTNIKNNYDEIYRIFLGLLNNDDAVEYLEKRCISKNQVIEHNIKNLPKEKEKQFFILEELLKYYEEEELLKSGIVNKNKEYGKLYLFHFRHRLIIPYFDIDGKTIISIQGRDIDNDDAKPKYLFNLYSKDSIYNIDKLNKNKDIILCEGVIDCLSLERLGYYAISLSGACKYNLLEEYDIIKNYNIYTFSDNDNAGDKLIKNLYKLDNYKGNFLIDKFIISDKYIKDINDILINVIIKSFKIDNRKYDYFEMPNDKICILDYYIFNKEELSKMKESGDFYNALISKTIIKKNN